MNSGERDEHEVRRRRVPRSAVTAFVAAFGVATAGDWLLEHRVAGYTLAAVLFVALLAAWRWRTSKRG